MYSILKFSKVRGVKMFMPPEVGYRYFLQSPNKSECIILSMLAIRAFTEVLEKSLVKKPSVNVITLLANAM